MADDTVRERALSAFEDALARHPDNVQPGERMTFAAGYLAGADAALTRALDELRAERTEWKGDAPREALRNAIVRIEKLKAGGT